LLFNPPTFEKTPGEKGRNEMATRNESKSQSAAGLKAGKRRPKPKKGGLKDLDAKNAKAVSGGLSCASGQHYNNGTITVRKPTSSP
jgi:hypothetical protein